MGLNDTPRGDRAHIGIFGRRNAGKSSLINALTGQDLAIVSPAPGTTTDPVYKSMELPGAGPVVFIDTAGFDDAGELGRLRTGKTAALLGRIDLAILVIDANQIVSDDAARSVSLSAAGPDDPETDLSWLSALRQSNVPVLAVLNKWDLLKEEQREAASAKAGRLLRKPEAKSGAGLDTDPGIGSKTSLRGGSDILPCSTVTGEGLASLRKALADILCRNEAEGSLLGDLADAGDLVLLVMPQNTQAPKGRLILPQVQTIRALLDRNCSIAISTDAGLAPALDSLSRNPDLIITDSQCFHEVSRLAPAGSRLTSFSILMAASKGDIHVFTEGAAAIDSALTKAGPFRVLIAEACTHVPQTEDIGTVRIPRMLEKLFGDRLELTNVRGNDFPDPSALASYDLIIHCGACMFNRRHVLQRMAAAQAAGVPITNYGIVLARMAGILDQVCLPGCDPDNCKSAR